MASQASSTRDSTQWDVWWGGATILEGVEPLARRLVFTFNSRNALWNMRGLQFVWERVMGSLQFCRSNLAPGPSLDGSLKF